MNNVLAFPARLHCKKVNGPWTSGTAAAPGTQIMQTTILIMSRRRDGQEFNVIAYYVLIQMYIWRNNDTVLFYNLYTSLTKLRFLLVKQFYISK